MAQPSRYSPIVSLKQLDLHIEGILLYASSYVLLNVPLDMLSLHKSRLGDGGLELALRGYLFIYLFYLV
jgi:hypothetical protein